MSRINKIAALVAGAILVAAAPATAQAQNVSPDDTARFLAGMQPSADSPLTALTRNPNWQRHAKWFDSNWSALEKQRLSRVRAWSDKHLKDRQYTLYYMFSGPDYLFADAFFPAANTYLLSAREPIGAIPRITERTIGWLPRIQQSVGTSLRLSFFITQHMREQLAGGGELAGTLPILLAFAVRSGKTIHEVSLVNLDKGGNLHSATGEARGMTPGVKVVLAMGGGPKQTLYYFRVDLSNALVADSGFLKFAATLAPGHSLIKSASYLLHGGNFTLVRDFILANSQSVVQDDSGIPFANFRADTWNFHPFGAYLGPIAIFPGRSQPRLGELFKKAKAPPLDFGIGYRHRGPDSNLLLAVRKEPLKLSTPQASQAAPPPTREMAAEDKLPPLPPPLPPMESMPLRKTVPADQPN